MKGLCSQVEKGHLRSVKYRAEYYKRVNLEVEICAKLELWTSLKFSVNSIHLWCVWWLKGLSATQKPTYIMESQFPKIDAIFFKPFVQIRPQTLTAWVLLIQGGSFKWPSCFQNRKGKQVATNKSCRSISISSHKSKVLKIERTK